MYEMQTTSPLRRRWMRLIDGERAWGSIDVLPDRFGVTRYRLLVYPPGIDRVERRWVRLARGWVLWGALVWVMCEAWLTQITGPWLAFVASTAAFIGVGFFAKAVAGRRNAEVKTMGVDVTVGYHSPETLAIRDRLLKCAVILIEADERLERGQISPADHELTWWRVYDDIGPSRAAA
jgi:hypothetical protein